MKSRMSFSFKVAMLSAATAAYLGTTVIFAQSGSGNGATGVQRAQAKPGLLSRMFSRNKKREAASRIQPVAQTIQYQQAPRGGQQKSKVQQLLEARYRAEGREIPPLTLEELNAQQQGQQPQQYSQPQTQQAPQQQYQQPRIYQQPSRGQQGYAAGASALPGNSYGSSSQTFGGQQAYAANNRRGYQKPATRKPKRRRGFRGFLSRINPFRKKRREEPTQPSTPAYNNQPVRQPRQQYAQQPAATPRAMPNRYATQPNYGSQPQAPAEPPRYQEPRPFPGVPTTVSDTPSEDSPFAEIAETTNDSPFAETAETTNDSPFSEPANDSLFAEPGELAAEDDLPSLADAQPEADLEVIEEESSPFDEEALPDLVAEDIPTDDTQVEDTLEESTEPKFQAPLVVETESVETDSSSPFSGQALDSEEEVSTEETVTEEEVSSETKLVGTEENLPKLERVPARNEYINLDKLNKLASSTDRAAMRREKRRLLLLSRPDKKGLKGFCPVSLKKERDLVDANPEYESEYNSKIYRFSSAEAKLAFDRSPEEYAPAKGGVDVVKHSLGAGDVEGTLEFAAWFRGKLYLFSSAVTYDAFMRSPAKFVDQQKKAAKAEETKTKAEPKTEAKVESEAETKVEAEPELELETETLDFEE